MAKPSVTFELGGGYWVAERQSVGFEGLTALGPVRRHAGKIFKTGKKRLAENEFIFGDFAQRKITGV